MTVMALASTAAGGDVRDRAEPETDDQERDLLVAAQRGDLGAFEALYRRNVKRLFALCWRLAADEPAAEELVQEVFVRAWGNLGGFRGDCSFASWLRRVAVHLFLDERRARRRGPQLFDGDDPALTDHPGPSAGEARMDLDRAVRQLPPRARAIFVLHDIEGHRHDEIAALLGIDAGTSKSQLHRARKLLREALS